jgi:hypothetical protein
MSTLTDQRAGVQKICMHLHHAYRGLRLYPADHPSAIQTIDALAETVDAHLRRFGPLAVSVEEACLLYEDVEVYSFADSRDNLAFLMFRDGIRSLSLHPGLEQEELAALVDCLAHADDLVEAEQDLATALWEQDFAHIDYVLADPFVGGAVLREGTVDALRETVLRRLDEVTPADLQTAAASGTGSVPVERTELGSLALTLTPEEIEQSERVVAERSGALGDFTLVLLEIVADPAGLAIGESSLCSALAVALEHHLEMGDLKGCNLLLERLQGLEKAGRLPDGFLKAVTGEALTPQRLGLPLNGIAQAPPERVAEVEGFLGTVRLWALPELLGVLAETDDRAVRRVVLSALQMEEGLPASSLWPLLGDLRWYVVRNAVQLLAGSSDAELPSRLERLLQHGDVRVRREVVRTLDTLGGTRPVRALVRALDDEDSSVRVLAAGSLGRHGGWEHHQALLTHLQSRDFDTRPAEEIEAFLVAFAALGGERSLSVLDQLWRRRLLKTRSQAVRLAALEALGPVRSPEAMKILKEAAGSKEPQVRRAASRILQERQAPGPGAAL